MMTRPVASSSAAAIRALFWIEREASGAFCRYVADLCDAWRGEADATVWLEPKESQTNRQCLADVRCSERWACTRANRARAARAMRELMPTVVLFVGTRAARHGLAAARTAGLANTVFVALSDELYQDTTLWKVARNYLRVHPLLVGARCVIVPSHGARYQFLLRDWIPEHRFVLLPKRCDPASLDPTARAALRREFGAGPTDCLIVYAGAFSDHARLDWLLRSWAHIEDRGVKARLALVGSGPMEPALRDLAARLDLEQCSFCAPNHPPQLCAAAADVVAMTSLYEVHSVLPLWAMAAGRPIVAMEADGVRMNFSHPAEGLLTPVGDVAAFADALCKLIRDPDRRARMGAEGLKRAADFGADAFRARARLVLDQLAKGARP